MIGYVYEFFLESIPEAMVNVCYWVGDVTESDSARIGAIMILFMPVVLVMGLGCVATTVVGGPFLFGYTIFALARAGVRHLARAYSRNRGAA